MPKTFIFSPEIREKLHAKHGVSQREVEQCFDNICGTYLEDRRPQHRTESGEPVLWFVAETNRGRWLKIVFVFENGNFFVRSAYDANDKVRAIYDRFGK